MSAGKRIDVLLVESGLAQSREKARALIMAGAVFADERRVDKPGEVIKDGQCIRVKDDALPFVSRGGFKLEKAVERFKLDLDARVAADIGASTGGFTDCMLQHGAAKVYAIDVGYGQLDWKLRNDPRVKVLERTNARYMAPEWFDPLPSFASIDVSFISLGLILPPLFRCLEDDGEVVALVKPQFEAGRDKVGKNGVVRSREVHLEVLKSTAAMARGVGFTAFGADYSPITGPKGNIEFLLHLKKGAGTDLDDAFLEKVVYFAHKTFQSC
ncbi:MAG: TlyA family RNA methyltransferase [Bacillota bacterium]